MAISVIERPERHLPARFAGVRIGEQPEVTEKYVHTIRVGDGARRRRRVGWLIRLYARPGRLALPEDFAARSIQTDRPQFAPIVYDFLSWRVLASATFS